MANDDNSENTTPNGVKPTAEQVDKSRTSDGISDGTIMAYLRDRRPLAIGIVLTILGAVISLYTVKHHLDILAAGHTEAFCNISKSVNCDAVDQSRYSEFLGVPVGIWGCGYFLGALVLLILGFSKYRASKDHLQTYAAMVLVGVVVSLGFDAIMAFVIHALCIACLSAHVMTYLQLATLVYFRREIPMDFTIKGLFNGATTAVVVVAASVGGYTILKPQLLTAPQSPVSVTTLSDSGEALPVLDKTTHEIPLNLSSYSGLGEDYRRGASNPSVTIVEFADFQCPPCRRMSGLLKKLVDENPDDIQVVFKNYPIDQKCNRGALHPFACETATLARCAGQIGKFWQFHDVVYAHQEDISSETVRTWAKGTGLTDAQIDQCLKSPDIIAKIKDDVALGDKIGVNGTPTIFFNGRIFLGGGDYNALKKALQLALDSAPQ